MKAPSSRRVSAIVILAVAFTSLSSILIRLSDAPPLVIAAWRMIIATVLLVPLGLRFSARRSRFHRSPTPRPSPPPQPSRVATATAVVLSGVFLAIHFATWITSLRYTTVLHSTVLVTIHPVIVLIASHFFLGDRIGIRRLLATAVAFAGAVILAGGGSVRGMEPTITGDALAVAGGVAVAVYLMIGRSARRTLSAGRYNAGVHLVAAVVLVVLTVLFGDRLAPYPPVEFAIFAALALFCTVLGHALMNWSLKYVSANDVSRSILLEPVFAAIPAAILFDEIPGVRTVFGAVIVLTGVGIVFFERKETVAERADPV